MQNEQARILLEKYLNGTASEAEKVQLESWYSQYELKGFQNLDAQAKEKQLDKIRIALLNHASNDLKPVKEFRLWPRIAVAASVLIVLSVGSYFILKPKSAEPQIVQVQQDLKPGTNGAILTLANGQKVVLEATKVGTIAEGIQKSNDSLLIYNGRETVGYNTLETPNGRQYTVVLPDGSKVWLNAASSLKYPTRFEKERLVELTGEAYFEVVHNSKMPFKVKTNKQITEDIGTSFNINSYNDEDATVTTLVEGAVNVNGKLVKPGFAAISKTPGSATIKQADIELVTAWKNGVFSYNKTEIKTMMRQFARWYDVD
ncbi:MAG: FecR family protein, partial [Chitinophagaceae bacterium]